MHEESLSYNNTIYNIAYGKNNTHGHYHISVNKKKGQITNNLTGHNRAAEITQSALSHYACPASRKAVIIKNIGRFIAVSRGWEFRAYCALRR